MSKGKRNKKQKKVHENKYAKYSKAEKEFARLSKPPEPPKQKPKPITPSYGRSSLSRPISWGSEYGLGSRIASRHMFGDSDTAPMRSTRPSDDEVTRENIYFVYKGYRLDDIDFTEALVPEVVEHIITHGLGRGKHRIETKNLSMDIQIFGTDSLNCVGRYHYH